MSRIQSVLFCMVLLFLVMFAIGTGHCSTSSNSKNSLGALTYQDNPFTYTAGSVSEVFVIGNKRGMVVRIQPLSTYLQFTSDLLFCDLPIDMLENKQNPIVLIYETKAHRTIEGIGCHNLVSVREVKPTKELGR